MIPQAWADSLIKMDKRLTGNPGIGLPIPGGYTDFDAESLDGREKFIFSIERGAIRLSKYSQQERYAESIPLIRLCVDFKEHTNPDNYIPLNPTLTPFAGMSVGRTHLHVYQEAVGTRFAIPVPVRDFPDLSNLSTTTFNFLRYCNVIGIGSIQAGLV
ncbi:MAG: hypothetical protein M0T81_07290 [Thermoplasmatales archaeon]|nr:hypothetical protein [Thermoplasmatales archaeon]